MRRKGRVDANQSLIVKQLRNLPGISVAVTSQIGDGFGDIVVGYRGVNYLFEIKDGEKVKSRRKLTKEEEKFHSKWNGRIDVVKNIDEIFNIVFYEVKSKWAT